MAELPFPAPQRNSGASGSNQFKEFSSLGPSGPRNGRTIDLPETSGKQQTQVAVEESHTKFYDDRVQDEDPDKSSDIENRKQLSEAERQKVKSKKGILKSITPSNKLVKAVLNGYKINNILMTNRTDQ